MMNPLPFNEGFLPEEEGHTIYFAQYGNKNGPVILSVHGGPGSKSKPSHPARHDLESYQIVVFDQRGSGKSTPLGSLEHNTTDKLVSDIERLREHIGVEKWYVSGGSWGAALSLMYAMAHSERVLGLLLASAFIMRPQDLSWMYGSNGGAARLFPDVWKRHLAFLKRLNINPEQAPKELSDKLKTADEVTVKDIVANFSDWEENLFSPSQEVKYTRPDDVTEEDIASVKLFLHYEANHFFVEEDYILKNISAIKHIPTIVVHGRYDIICPLDSVWEVIDKLDNARIVVAPSSGHALNAEAEVIKKLAFKDAMKEWTG